MWETSECWGAPSRKEKVPTKTEDRVKANRSLEKKFFGCILLSLASHLRRRAGQELGPQADLTVNPGPATDSLHDPRQTITSLSLNPHSKIREL